MRNVSLYYSQLIQPLKFFATVNFCTNIQYKMATGKRASQNNLKLFEKLYCPQNFGTKMMIPKLWSCCHSLMHRMFVSVTMTQEHQKCSRQTNPDVLEWFCCTLSVDHCFCCTYRLKIFIIIHAIVP